MSAKVSYMKLLKEAISEFDTSKSVDVKGPMLDPILSYKGGGELPTHKDAASILERYYFQEDEDRGVSVNEDTLAADDNEIDAIPGKDPQATKKDIEDEVTEGEEVTEAEEEDEEEPAEVEQEGSAIVDLENSVIEKLIGEMEDEAGDEEVEESNNFAGDEGEGTEAAGTGNADDQVPDRKDITKEQDEEEGDEEEEVDLDKGVKSEGALTKARTRNDYDDVYDNGNVEEAFQIFKEQILEEADEEDEEEEEAEETTEAFDFDSDEILV